MANAIEVVSEKVFSDGSGAVGTYKIYGKLYQGSHNGTPGSAKAWPQAVPVGPRSRREKGMVSTACRKIEQHIEGICGSKMAAQ